VFLHQGIVEEDGRPQEVFANSKSERFRQFVAK
jgi:octopine/nopaline transport system ATP-binding protein